jgi:hypothetical protein
MSTATTAPRLSLINPETASKPIKDALALLPVINVFRALANAESLYPYFSNYMLQLFRPMELDKALERMIVLHVTKRSDCNPKKNSQFGRVKWLVLIFERGLTIRRRGSG